MKAISRVFDSNTIPGRTYTASVSVSCPCPSFTVRKVCAHVRAIVGELLPAKPEPPKREPGRRRRRTVTLPVPTCPSCNDCSTASRDKDGKVWRCFRCHAELPEVRWVTS